MSPQFILSIVIRRVYFLDDNLCRKISDKVSCKRNEASIIKTLQKIMYGPYK